MDFYTLALELSKIDDRLAPAKKQIRTTFKIEKLKIIAYKEKERYSEIGTFEAMFNPASYSRTYANSWQSKSAFGQSAMAPTFVGSKPGELSLDLVLDGTGVHLLLGAGAIFRKSVQQRIADFLKVAYTINGDKHAPNYLRVSWGALSFDGRLSSVDIKYTSFNRDGTPLRAELAPRFILDEPAERSARGQNRHSPDITRARTVRSGDTLPLLTREIYGSSEYYLGVARFNQLDDFRNLQPGTQLLFPPLVQLPGGGAVPG